MFILDGRSFTSKHLKVEGRRKRNEIKFILNQNILSFVDFTQSDLLVVNVHIIIFSRMIFVFFVLVDPLACLQTKLLLNYFSSKKEAKVFFLLPKKFLINKLSLF